MKDTDFDRQGTGDSSTKSTLFRKSNLPIQFREFDLTAFVQPCARSASLMSASACPQIGLLMPRQLRGALVTRATHLM